MTKKELLKKNNFLEMHKDRNYSLYYTTSYAFLSLIDTIDQEGKLIAHDEKKSLETRQYLVRKLHSYLEALCRGDSLIFLTIFYHDLKDRISEHQFDEQLDDSYLDGYSFDLETANRYIDLLEWLLSSHMFLHTCLRWGICCDFCNGKVPRNKFRPDNICSEPDIIIVNAGVDSSDDEPIVHNLSQSYNPNFNKVDPK